MWGEHTTVRHGDPCLCHRVQETEAWGSQIQGHPGGTFNSKTMPQKPTPTTTHQSSSWHPYETDIIKTLANQVHQKNHTTTDWDCHRNECLEHSGKKSLILEKGSEHDQKCTVQLIKIFFKFKCIWEKNNLIMGYITITKNDMIIHF